MLKKHLIKAVAERGQLSLVKSREVLEALEAVVLEAVARGEAVMLCGLGQLTVSQRGPKRARNIWTGETVIVPPRNVPLFKASVGLHDAANQPPVSAA